MDIRLAKHHSGHGANHTKKRLPVLLVYLEEHQRIDEAFYREKQIQGWSRAKKEALIQNKVEELSKLSECKNDSHYALWLRLRSATEKRLRSATEKRLRSATEKRLTSTSLSDQITDTEEQLNLTTAEQLSTKEKP